MKINNEISIVKYLKKMRNKRSIKFCIFLFCIFCKNKLKNYFIKIILIKK